MLAAVGTLVRTKQQPEWTGCVACKKLWKNVPRSAGCALMQNVSSIG